MGWLRARSVHAIASARRAVKVLLLTTDAYGGHGGIALYNRDLAEAIAAMPDVREVVVAARVQRLEAGQIPTKIRYVTSALGGKLRYVKAALALAQEHFDLLICGHVNLLPLAAAVKRRLRVPLVLMVYGIDVWKTPGWLTRRCMRAVDAVWSISAITRDKMNAWAELSDDRYTLLPNAIHLDRYAPGAKPDY